MCKDLKLTVAFKLNVHSKEQTATLSVYDGKQKLSTVRKEFIIDPPPQEIEAYIDDHCLDEYEAQDTWCRYMRGEELDPEPAEDYADFLLSRIDNLEHEIDMYRKALGVKEGEVPWALLYDDDELPF